ncbi:MAG: PQQ-binding-like beta-propeller repeat protein, partial [Planctomycetota bacterium]
LAVGGYFLCAEYLAHGTVNAYTASHRQLEEANAAAQTLIAEGKYEEGLQQLRAFTTLDPEVRKLANEKFQERQKDVEALLSQAIERFDNAYRGSTPEELKAAAAGLQPLIHMSVHTSLLETRRAQTRIKLDAYLDTQRATQFKQRLNEIENTAGQNHETRLQAYTALLTEDPPEGVAAKVRADADRLAHELQAAARWLRQARKYRDAGDPETAKLFYEKAQEAAPGSAAAVEAGTEREAANAAATAQQAECERIEALPQNKSAEARAALLKFLESKPGPIPTQRALAILQGLQPVQADEMELAAGLKAAKALLDKQPPDVEGARQKTLELADKQPYAKASRAACLKVELTSQPEGANVAVNGKPAGVTTLKADIPVLGFVHLAFSKEGCRTEDLLLNNCRAERLSAVLDRNPAASSRLPVAGQLGLCVEGEQLFVGGFSAAQAAPPEIVACSHPDMKVLQRIKLQKSVQSVPALTVFSGEAFVPTHENTLLAVNLVRGEIHPLDLGAPASSTPVFFTSTDDAGGERQFMGIATQAGYECYQAGAEAWKLLNRTPLAGANKPAPQGMAFDGERCFLPRNDFAVHAVGAQNGKWAWKKALDAELSGPPALFPFVMPGAIRTGAAAVAVATLGGKVAAFDAQGGTEIWRRDKGAAVPAGLASAGSGFLVARCDGTVELLPLNMKGAPLWTVSLMGEPALTPFVLRDKANPQGKAIIICTKAPKEGAPGAAGGTAVLTILAPDSGKVLWRTALEAPIVALAASNERLYVCTADFELTAFDLK